MNICAECGWVDDVFARVLLVVVPGSDARSRQLFFLNNSEV